LKQFQVNRVKGFQPMDDAQRRRSGSSAGVSPADGGCAAACSSVAWVIGKACLTTAFCGPLSVILFFVQLVLRGFLMFATTGP
jgi:hypothetical protein